MRQKPIGLSAFGEFLFDANRITFTKDGKELDKWEVFELGYRNLNDIIEGKTPIKIKR